MVYCASFGREPKGNRLVPNLLLSTTVPVCFPSHGPVVVNGDTYSAATPDTLPVLDSSVHCLHDCNDSVFCSMASVFLIESKLTHFSNRSQFETDALLWNLISHMLTSIIATVTLAYNCTSKSFCYPSML